MRLSSGLAVVVVGLLLAVSSTAWIGYEYNARPPWLGTSQSVANLPLVSPGPVEYDPAGGVLWVASGGFLGVQGRIPVVAVDPSSGQPVMRLNVTCFANGGVTSMAVDPESGLLFVACYGGNVSWLNGSTGAIEGSVALRTGTAWPATVFDPTSGDVFVTGEYATSILSGNNGSLLGTIAGDGIGLAVNPYQGLLYVEGPVSVTSIDTRTDRVVANLSGLSLPPLSSTLGIAYDRQNDNVYVASGLSPNASSLIVLNGSALVRVGTVSLGGPWSFFSGSVVSDPANGWLYVGADQTLNVIDGNTDAYLGSLSIPLSTWGGIAFDSGNSNLYLTPGLAGDALWVVTPSAPAPETVTVILGLPGVGWAFFGIALGATLTLAGALTHRKQRKEPSSP